jgi:L-alanine-DL-glutamate epimerase-like enolase superfamily enzyme
MRLGIQGIVLEEAGCRHHSSPTIQKVGGIGEAQKVANMAQAYYIPSRAALRGLAHRSDGYVLTPAPRYPNFLCMRVALDQSHLDTCGRRWVKEGEIIMDGYVTPTETGLALVWR